MSRNKIIVSVSNNLENDQRVNRICDSLEKNGFSITLLGRRFRGSEQLDPRTYKTKRLKLLFNKGLLFYACLNIRLFIFLIFRKFDFLIANDLDTLAANTAVAFFRRKKLFYDSHELFTEVPELTGKSLKKKIWLLIEGVCIKRVFKAYTVCNPIANYHQEKYGIKMYVIRNLPIPRPLIEDYRTRENIIIYQGALNKERGIEIMIKSMQFLHNCKLLIAGKGDLELILKHLTRELKLTDKVIFTGNLNFEDLFKLTSKAKIGLSLEQGESLNYRFALPNKIFDYIQSGVPVICSDLPEMSKVVTKYNVGISININSETKLAEIISELLNDEDKLYNFSNNCNIAAKELNWSNEENILQEIFN